MPAFECRRPIRRRQGIWQPFTRPTSGETNTWRGFHSLSTPNTVFLYVNGTVQAIENHLKHYSHPTSGFHLSIPSISSTLDHWHVQTGAPQQHMHPVVPVSGIEPPHDGYQCPECPYAVSADDAARKHTNQSGGHKMKHGQVQRVQRIYWKILPEENWETSHSADLTPEDSALINAITDSLMNPQSPENETGDVCVCQPVLP
jgi:hypothetical protein